MRSLSAGSTAATVASFRPLATSFATSVKSRAALQSHTARIVEPSLHGPQPATATWSMESANPGDLRKQALVEGAFLMMTSYLLKKRVIENNHGALEANANEKSGVEQAWARVGDG